MSGTSIAEKPGKITPETSVFYFATRLHHCLQYRQSALFAYRANIIRTSLDSANGLADIKRKEILKVNYSFAAGISVLLRHRYVSSGIFLGSGLAAKITTHPPPCFPSSFL